MPSRGPVAAAPAGHRVVSSLSGCRAQQLRRIAPLEQRCGAPTACHAGPEAPKAAKLILLAPGNPRPRFQHALAQGPDRFSVAQLNFRDLRAFGACAATAVGRVDTQWLSFAAAVVVAGATSIAPLEHRAARRRRSRRSRRPEGREAHFCLLTEFAIRTSGASDFRCPRWVRGTRTGCPVSRGSGSSSTCLSGR